MNAPTWQIIAGRFTSAPAGLSAAGHAELGPLDYFRLTRSKRLS